MATDERGDLDHFKDLRRFGKMVPEKGEARPSREAWRKQRFSFLPNG